MDKETALKEMMEIVVEFGTCSVYLEDGDQVCIDLATDYDGGEEGYYMCSELGNIQYDDILEICSEVLEYIGDRVVETVEVD